MSLLFLFRRVNWVLCNMYIEMCVIGFMLPKTIVLTIVRPLPSVLTVALQELLVHLYEMFPCVNILICR